jgi:phage terminase large subunit-like protein
MKKKTSSSKSDPADRPTQYCHDVLSGKIVAGPHVRNACRRHLNDIEHAGERGFYYDPARAAWAIKFFETKLHLSEGQFEGLPFKADPSQAFIIGSLYGWKHKATGLRRFRRAYVEEGKGNGKSPLVGGIGLLGLTADGEAGAEIYSAGATKEQAAILFRDAVKMAKQAPDLKSRLKFSGGEQREYNIAYLKTGSFFRPVSRETKKTGSGPRPHYALCDEVHEHPDRGTMEMLERGFKFRLQPLLFMITNSGTDRNSIAWEEHEHAVKVAAGNYDALTDPTFLGEVIDDTTFSYVCALDEGDDPLNDPTCWPKANPLLGVTITEEYLAGVVAQAKAMPGKLNGILRLHFCVWTDAETAWMTREVLEPALADFDIEEHFGQQLFVGLDLSENRDITAAGFCVQTGFTEVEVTDPETGETYQAQKPTYDAWAEGWTPGDTYRERELRDKLPYSVWIRDRYLHAPPGQSVSYLDVAQRLSEYNRDFQIELLAYDRYAYRRFEKDAEQINLNLPYIEHPQGGIRKGVALNGMDEGLWMPGSVRIMEDALLEGRVRLLRNPALISAIMSAVTEEDRWNNRWLSKAKSVNKIDMIIAILMAIGAATAMERKAVDVFAMVA